MIDGSKEQKTLVGFELHSSRVNESRSNLGSRGLVASHL